MGRIDDPARWPGQLTGLRGTEPTERPPRCATTIAETVPTASRTNSEVPIPSGRLEASATATALAATAARTTSPAPTRGGGAARRKACAVSTTASATAPAAPVQNSG